MSTIKSLRFLVTGANGYLGSWIVKLLLEDGHEVRGTLRDAPDHPRYAHLHQLAARYGDRLSLHSGPLDGDDGFPALVQDCDFAIHTASPFQIADISDPDRQLVRPAVEGTRRVIRAALQASRVRRVILTSSAAAIYGDAADRDVNGSAFTEAEWNATSSLQHQPYAYSKVLAERAAWDLTSGQTRCELVVLNPGFMLGPAVARDTPGVSQTIMRRFADGTYRSGIVDLWYGLVDVRDVARAHIVACFATKAGGRFLLSAHDGSLWFIAQQLRRQFGDAYRLPRKRAPKPILWAFAPRFGFTRRFVRRNIGIPVRLDSSKSRRELGVTYRPIAQTLHDHFAQIVEKEPVNPPHVR